MTKKKRKPLSSFLQVFLVLLLPLTFPAAGGAVSFWILVAILLAAVIGPFYLQWQAHRGRREKVSQSGIKEIDVMQGKEFENYLSVLFGEMGYKVERTPDSSDYGADLLLRKNKKHIVVQAKKCNKSVGVASVQQVFSAKMYYSAHEAWVVTNHCFSKNAYELAKRSGVKLIAREQLVSLITENMVDTPVSALIIHQWNER